MQQQEQREQTFITQIALPTGQEFHDQKIQKRADYFKIRQENKASIEQQIFDVNQLFDASKKKYEREVELNKQKQFELEQLKQEQQSLYRQYEIQRRELYERQL